ncbi:interferon-induced very large GTPase 1-like isoform X1 [Maylandia zebra]|uniref:interferon-induced very large GTPase 1-like isoform X1 n=2 Tax=Maylandia zebra TaxID=106582 RepID=UPI00403C4BFD
MGDPCNNTAAESGGVPEVKAENKGPSEKDMSGKRSVKISDEIKKKRSCQRPIEALLHRLHLPTLTIQKTHQQKLSPEDLLQIRPSVTEHHVSSEKNLAHVFLHRLMMLDYRARYIPIRQDSPEETITHITEKENSDWETFLNSSVDTEQSHVHPMDVQMAVFHCSDNFLKQMMVTKLSQCQYALPLLVPDPVTKEIQCPLWTFRQIRKPWKVTQIQDGSRIVNMKSIPVCKAQTPLVSFFRLGSPSVSKSQLLNALINDRHSTFFHRNCPGSTRARHLMDGVAEIAWYCPAGKPTDAFSDCIAFCNLHGDALKYKTQCDILIERSSINIFLVPSLQNDEESKSLISTLFQSHKPLICLIEDESGDAAMTKKGKHKMGLKCRHRSDVSEELTKIIREILSSLEVSSSKPLFQLESMAELPGVRVDESDLACQKGRSAALEIVDMIKKDNVDISVTKDKFLPFQACLRHQCLSVPAAEKQQKNQQQLMGICQKQPAASCSKLMELFIKNLWELPPKDRDYFLKWTQIFMDDLSTENISSLLQSFDDKWSEVKCDKSGPLLMKQTELVSLVKKLQSASFGLEHIFREMGQIYEAQTSTTERESRPTGWCEYPKLAAQLMISGHPVELMDGDAGHLPLKWISSLLEEVMKTLGDQKVFVLSVLGLQSSGKSTMLNAMFGLQSAVSADRCTKGAFMQLIKFSEEMKKDLKSDYVLVVHTEGLQAMDSNTTHHHDDKLATFVVGLGNLTLINLFGDNLLMNQGILQIVVQAFMRLKKAQLSPRCVFAYHNVTDVVPQNKMDRMRCLQEQLDHMTKLAAREELCDAECFSDVTEFDVQNDVKYCAQLWESSSPMGPPNPNYSESLQEVKDTILSLQSGVITVSQLRTNVENVWTTLLKESTKAVTAGQEKKQEILKNLRHATPESQQYVEGLLKQKSVSQKELLMVCSLFMDELGQSCEANKRRSSSSRSWIRCTAKVCTVVTGETFRAHASILEQVNSASLEVQITSPQDCDIIMVFCPITARIGSDVAAALSREEVSSSEKPAILVLMHHTRNVQYSTGGRNWAENYPTVKLEVHVFFHDSQHGLLKCKRNEQAVKDIQKALYKQGKSRWRM